MPSTSIARPAGRVFLNSMEQNVAEFVCSSYSRSSGVLVMRLDIGRGLGFAGYTLSMLIVLAIVIA